MLSLSKGTCGIDPELPRHKAQQTSKVTTRSDVPKNAVQHTLANQSSKQVFLQTLVVQICNGNKCKEIRVLIDTGSQRSYILKSAAVELGFQVLKTKRLAHALFGGHCTPEQKHNCYNINIEK